MAIAGLLVAFAGFVLSLMSLGMTSSPGTRMAVVLAGIAISLTGILGVLNRAYLRNAIWKK
jgi:hypothetical protein